jgi:uncharacterized protein (DUF58 family)
MFTSVWLEFAAMMVVFAALLGQESLLVLATLLVTILPIGWAWQRLAFWRVSYERHLSETRVFEGERVTLNLRLTNRKWLPLAWIRVTDRLPLALSPQEKTLAPSHIPLTGFLEQRASFLPFERARWEYHIPCNHRGYYAIGPAQLKTGDLFGLFEREWEHPRVERLIVYPQIFPLEEWGLPPKEPFGDTRTRIPMFEDPTRVRGLRDYRSDDAPKHIHWRATARRNELQVKVYEPTINYTWVLFLNIATYEQAWQGVDTALAERTIRLAASLANFAAERKYAIGLIANGTWPDSDQRLKILPGRSPDQLRNVLEALAAVSYFVTSPIENLLRRESASLPWGATLLVVTPLITENLLAEMIRLQQVGRRLALVSLDEKWNPQPLPGIVVRQAHAPGGEFASMEMWEKDFFTFSHTPSLRQV